MKKYIKIIFFSIWVLQQSFAQSEFNLKGKILDADTKKTIPYAYVRIENTTIGTVSNENGLFSLTVPEELLSQKISFTYLGYKKQEILIQELIYKKDIVILLKTSPAELEEIVVKAVKLPSAKAILKRAIRKIPENYYSTATYLNGYYSEILSENDKVIKYSDAVCKYKYEGYNKKSYGNGDYDYGRSSVSSLSSFYSFSGGSLHRSHFHYLTGKNDQVKIIDARASDNLSKKRMTASIQGGPLGLLAKDKVKYRASFLDLKKLDSYDYSIRLRTGNDGTSYYEVKFKTNISVDKLEKLFQKGKDKQWNLANNNKLLEGKIHIDKESMAITYFECKVPTEYKKYFCSYKAMAIKHFDYKVKAFYKNVGGKYCIDSLWQEDEFIYEDTIQKSITPYSAVAQVKIINVETDSVKPFKKSEIFANLPINQLYDYPTSYNEVFWKSFYEKHPQFNIPPKVRKDMEENKTLEQQFKEKHIRNDNMPAPIAQKIPDTIYIHGDTLIDNYAWLKDTKAPIYNDKVMDYLYAENKYTENHFKPLRSMQRHVFQEFMNRTEKNYTSLPIKENGYYYHYSYTSEQEYPVYFRNKIGNNVNDTLLDVNKMAKEKKGYYSAGNITPSPNNQIIAFYENTTGSDRYILKFKNLTTNQIINDSLSGIGDVVWLNDSVLLYTKQEAKTFRSYMVMKHTLLSPQSKDENIYIEKDSQFGISLNKTHSKKYVRLITSSSETSECYFLDVTNSNARLNILTERKKGHSYTFDHFDNDFYIMSNNHSINYAVYTTSEKNYAIKNWKTIVSGQQDVLISDFTLFNNFIVIHEKEKAQPRIKIIDRTTFKSHFIKFKEDIYSTSILSNPDIDTNVVRINFSSPITPNVIYDYNMETKELIEIKKQIVELMPWKNSIKVKRVWATAHDGVKIPITLYYYKYFFHDKRFAPQKMFLTSYGSYGSGIDAGYNLAPYVLINKGFVYAIAHVRGGDDLGRKWYEDGKMMNKKNTFTDFISCAEYLVQEKYADLGQIVAQGGSAGGLLMGAIANMRPDLFKLVILDVPFVDVVNTMLDKDLPLTTMEYGEWGNPKIKAHYDYIKSYSPYDNIKKQAYPNMLFMTGLNDTRVGYWEPTKMVAKLRDYNTSNNKILLKTELYAGHGGNSGRYAYYRSLAYKYAVILDIFEKERPLTKYEKD